MNLKVNIKKIKGWIKGNKLEFVLICALFILTLFFRFYRLGDYMSFLGDEGRDAIVIKRILTEADFPLLGPTTSVGNMYLGPLYYYMMAVSMAIFWLNPVAAAGMVALIGSLTVLLVYFITRWWFGMGSALIAAWLYSISPVNIIYSKSSWNPNPAPFFALIALLTFSKAHRSGNFKWIILTGVALAFAVQMHYLALILIPVYGVLWLYELILIKRNKLKRENFFIGSAGGAFAFFFLMLPLFIFDLKYNFMNFRAVTTFFFAKNSDSIGVSPLGLLGKASDIYNYNLIARYMSGENLILAAVLSVLVLLPVLTGVLLKFNGRVIRWSIVSLGIWLVLGVFGLSLYKQSIYDHYLGFLNPVSYILLGANFYLINNYWAKFKIVLKPILFGLVVLLSVVNLERNPLLSPPNYQLKRTQEVAKYIINNAEGKHFNFALIAEKNYDSAYQYYLDIYGHKAAQAPFELGDFLFVVCEDVICQPINHSKFEISSFGPAKIENVREVAGVKVFKLSHNLLN